MKPGLTPLAVLALAGMLARPLRLPAQEQAPPPAPAPQGNFETQGSVTTGYRFTEFKGRQQKFLELFDLQKGFRVMDFSVFGRAKEGTSPLADSFSVNVSGLGGDPFPGGQVTVRKSQLYDLRVSYRQSYYYWDRNDSVVPPAPAGYLPQHGMTTNHDWATVRRFGSANFLLHATKNLRFSFEYNRNSRDGLTFTTRVMDYFGAPDSWGSFTRANPYYVEAPISEVADRVVGGLDYSWWGWDVHYRAGYQTFEQSLRWNNTFSPEQSINTDAPATANELLTNGSWSDFRRLKTPISEVSYTGKAGRRIELRGGYIFYRYHGPANFDAAYQGSARTNSSGTQDAPYSISADGRALASEGNHILDQGLTLEVNDWWNVHLDYRYFRVLQDAHVNFHSLRDGTQASDGEETDVWRQGLHQLDFMMEFTPSDRLVIRPGIRLLKRDTIGLVDGVADDIRTRRVNTAWPLFSLYYQPTKMFSVRGDFQSITNGASYTRITPHTDRGGRLVLRFHPSEKLAIEENLLVRDRRFLDTDFHNTFRSNASTISYALSDRFSIFGGFSYDSFYATASVTFLRGVPPLETSWRDQTVNRVWQAGLNAKPTRNFGFMFTGNLVRSTGAGQISGEPPYFGPLRWPMATGTVYFDIPRAGRLSVDLQRTYYIEEIITGNNFSANLLTIRWTKDF